MDTIVRMSQNSVVKHIQLDRSFNGFYGIVSVYLFMWLKYLSSALGLIK